MIPTPLPFLPPDRIEIIGHRGDPVRAPENTLPSIEGAIEAGAPSVEWDVRVAACGTPVVIHDDTVDRTTDGTGRVDTQPWSALARLDAGSWFEAAFAGTRIPTLEQALATARRGGVGVYCEVKSIRGPDDAARIAELIREQELESRTVVISIGLDIVETFRQVDPGLWVAPVPDTEEAMVRALDWIDGQERVLLDPDAELLLADPARTQALVADGPPVATWTVDDETRAEALLELGVTRITTNRVRELLAWADAVGGT